MIPGDQRSVTWGELHQVLRHLERFVHPQASGAATLGSLRQDRVEATRSIAWEETQDETGAFRPRYGDPYV